MARWRIDGKVNQETHTIVGLQTHIFPEALLHCCTGLHVACSHVLPTFEELSLPPPAVDSFAILGGSGHGRWRRRTCCCDGERGGGPACGGMKALGQWYRDWRDILTRCNR